ncbi:MAG: hypothetical protein K8S54_19580 [Spirochaetia bacterium]|nr:hypothetical protein [Spirochaetia bacterium]
MKTLHIVSFVRYYVVLMLFWAVSLGAVETEMQTRTSKVVLTSLSVDQWKKLALGDRRWIAPRLLDLGVVNASVRNDFIEILESDTDPFVRAHGLAARSFFTRTNDLTIRDDLNILASRAESVQLRDIYQYYSALVGGIPTATLANFACKVSEFEDACRFLRLRILTESLSVQPVVTYAQMRDLQNACAPFLLKNALRPAFFHRLGAGVAERLNRLKLPLEAAIIQERMLRGIENDAANESRSRIPFYLASAGDFASALRYTESRALRNMDLKMARLDWMILSGRYKEAVDFLSELIESNVDLSALRGRDPWTGFQYSREGLRLRLALVLHLAGDTSKAARALEMLKENSGKTEQGEPIALYAKIRLAQILLKDRPELAHKLAEDVTYEAQEKGWAQLEYFATILDGWALYYSKQYFNAVVNFTKAGGIVQNPPAEYSRLLGLMASQLAMAPASPQTYIVTRLKQMLAARPYHRAIYTIRDWVPEDAGDDFFLEQAVLNAEARRDRWSALSLLEEFKRLEEYYFAAGNNPGGIRGIVTSDVWYRTLREFPSVRAVSRGVLDDAPDNLRTTINSLVTVPPLRLVDDSAFLFPYTLRGRAIVYLVAPSPPRNVRAARLIVREDIPQSEYEVLRAKCLRGCPDNAFPELRKLAGSFRMLQIQTRATDLDFGALLKRPGLAIFRFYDGLLPAKPYQAQYRGAYRAGCPAAAGDAATFPFGESMFSAGFTGFAFYWPLETDARTGEDGEKRPVYLRNFVCGDSRVRFWDLDRFWNVPPELIIYRDRMDDADLDQAFLRFAAGSNIVLLETNASWTDVHAAFLREQARTGATYPVIQERMQARFPDLIFRFYFPGPAGK